MKKMTKDNRGLSLIELLVAIVVLGIVCIPLITTFINSAKINRNAQRVHSSSTLAQSIMERYKATDLEKMIADVSGSTTVSMNSSLSTSTATTPAQQQTVSENQAAFTQYTFFEPNLDAGNGQKYDARITLNPVPYSSFDTVSDSSDINIAQIPELPMVDNAKSPVIANQISAQDWDGGIGERAIEKKIYSLLGKYSEDQIKTIIGSSVDLKDGYQSLSSQIKKEIVVTVTPIDTKTAEVRCDLNYTYPLPGGVTDVYTVNAYQGRYSMDLTGSDDATDTTIEGRLDVYLFWTRSFYNTTQGDTIRIINDTDCRVDVYLIRQEGGSSGSTYKLSVEDSTGSTAFSETAYANGRLCARNINLITNLTDSSKLYDMESQVRCYEITVDLFEAGKTEVVTTLTSTKEIYQ